MNKQPIYSSLVYRRESMIRKVFWKTFSVVMGLISFVLVGVCAWIEMFGSALAAVSLCALLNIIVCGFLWRMVDDE